LLAEGELGQPQAGLARVSAGLTWVEAYIPSCRDPDGAPELRRRKLGRELGERRPLEQVAHHRSALKHELARGQSDGQRIELQPGRLIEPTGYQGGDLPLAQDDWILPPRAAGIPLDELG